jgi:hypothetical protein
MSPPVSMTATGTSMSAKDASVTGVSTQRFYRVVKVP